MLTKVLTKQSRIKLYKGPQTISLSSDMRILRHTLKIYAIKPVRVLFFSLVSACSFIPSSFPGSGINHIAYAQEANSPDNPQETNRNKLTKEQQQEIIEKNATIRK